MFLEMRESKTLNYFGYGANASPSLMRALLGRVPESVPAMLRHYRLYIEPWHAIPPVAQAKLIDYWKPKRFQRYVIRRRRGQTVEGVLWGITPVERRIIREWDMSDGKWTEEQFVVVKLPNEERVLAETDIRSEWSDDLILSSGEQVFLNDRNQMVSAAERVRQSVTKHHSTL
jgi:hypothetical protein